MITSSALMANWAAVLSLIMGGCCSNVFALEVLIRHEPGSGHLITLAQFLFVALEGLYWHLQWIPRKERKVYHFLPLRFKPRTVPLYHWLAMVILFWSVSVLNNYALAFDIPMPFHIVFRSAGLVISLLLSWLLLGQTFTKSQIGAVLTVSAGILIATLASAASGNDPLLNLTKEDPTTWLMGIGILILALLLSAIMGQYQQYIFSTFGRDWRESLFYTHFLALPAFAFMASSIYQEWIKYSESPTVYPFESLVSDYDKLFGIPLLATFSVPYLWFYLLLNVLTQYGCIAGVQKLSSMSNAVTLNLVLSLRKFISLVISISLFKNVFTVNHWIGTILVFVGTIWYSLSSTSSKMGSSVTTEDDKKKK